MKGIDLSISIKTGAGFCDKASVSFFYDLLLTVPREIGLVALQPPIVFTFPTCHVPTEKGVSGIIVMVQSHMAFHWWPETNFVHITISSCKAFDGEKVLEYCSKLFEATDIGAKKVNW